MAKRLNDEGSITWSKAKQWWDGRISINGERKGVYKKTHAEVKVALKGLIRKKDDREKIVLAHSGMSFKDYITDWLDIMERRLKPSSYEGYESMVRVHLIPRLKNIKLIDITPEIIGNVWTRMGKEGLSATLITHCHRRLSKALADASEKTLIPFNPCQKNDAKPPHIDKKVINPFTEEERLRLLATFQKDYPEYHPVVFMALHTGMRRNELLALKWRDIDLETRSIYVNGNMFRKNRQTIYHSPKTTLSQRLVKLAPEAVAFMEGELKKQTDNSIFFGYKVDKNSHVFIRTEGNPTGEYKKDKKGKLELDTEGNPIPVIESIPFLPNTVSHTFKKVCRRLGLDANKMNDNRHTHATILFKRGTHPKIVQERLGHSSINVTMNIYSHVLPSMQEDAVKDLVLSPETADQEDQPMYYEDTPIEGKSVSLS